jgi:DNA-binding CsgD family transcriptional regulator
MAVPDPTVVGQSADPDPADGERDVPAVQAWLSALPDGADQRLARVAALGQRAQLALSLGQAGECLAALAEQQAAAGHDQAAMLWALTTSSVCRAAFGQLRRARADLADARRVCHNSAPVLAEPFWRFAEVLCSWLEGRWPAAQEDAAVLGAGQLSPLAPGLAGAVAALRIELLRGLGLPQQSRLLAERLGAASGTEMGAWALAGLDVEQGRSAGALRRLADARDAGERGVYRAALPLVLHRMAETAFACAEPAVTAQAAADLAGLDQVTPLTEILTGLAHAYASGDARPARRAQQRAEAEGAGALAAEALTVRGQIGDEPAKTLLAAHTAWRLIGALGKVNDVAVAIRAAGLPAPAIEEIPWVPRISAEGPAPLTARERSLARLIHEGRTNQHIARTLHISVKTVEAYLTRIYRKTSCSSRVELAVAVTEGRIQVGE